MTRKVKKRKLNVVRVLIFLAIVLLFILSIYLILRIKVKNIVIKGTNFYTDKEIIEVADLENYPSFLEINTFKIKKDLEDLDLIKSAKIKRKFGFKIEIILEDKKILYQRKSDGLYVLDTGEEINKEGLTNIPLLINYYPNTLDEKALKAFGKLTQETINKISSIEYSKTAKDDERFLLYMADGNLVYINLNRMKNLNKYTQILNEVGTKKGILNLDNGNYFEIKEK